MLVRDAMSRPAYTVGPNATLKEAMTLLDERSVTSLPVVNAAGRILGIVSEADLIAEMVPPDTRLHMVPESEEAHVMPAQSVAEVMNRHPVTVSLDTDLAEATDLMTSTAIKSLPVLDEHQRVVGMVSRRDVVQLLARPDAVLEGEVDDLFRRMGKDWLVDVRDGVVTVTGPVDERERHLATTAAGTVPGVTGVDIT